MLRRAPTRIELKLEDLQEYETMRRQMDPKKDRPATPWTAGPKTKQELVQERIGYVPQPREH